MDQGRFLIISFILVYHIAFITFVGYVMHVLVL